VVLCWGLVLAVWTTSAMSAIVPAVRALAASVVVLLSTSASRLSGG
jgi:hypothetical protein